MAVQKSCKNKKMLVFFKANWRYTIRTSDKNKIIYKMKKILLMLIIMIFPFFVIGMEKSYICTAYDDNANMLPQNIFIHLTDEGEEYRANVNYALGDEKRNTQDRATVFIGFKKDESIPLEKGGEIKTINYYFPDNNKNNSQILVVQVYKDEQSIIFADLLDEFISTKYRFMCNDV